MKKNKNKNKGGFLFSLLIPLVLAGFFGFGRNAVTASSSGVIINEIQVSGKSADDEFIELYNLSDKDIDLSDWSIQYRGGGGTKYYRKNFTRDSKIKSSDYFLIAHNSFSGSVVPNMKHSTFTLSSEKTGAGGTIFLVKSQKNLDEITPDPVIIDEVGYGVTYEYEYSPAHKPEANQSIERKNFIDTDNNYGDFNPPGTPSPQNSTPDEPKPDPEPKIYSDKIIINEVLPNPKGTDSEGEFIEFYNSSAVAEDLENWKLKDNNGNEHILKKIGGISLEIKPAGYLIINPNDYGVYLHNTVDENMALLDPKSALVSSVSYKSQGIKEDVSYNFDGADWHWSNKLTPGKENRFNNLPEVNKKKDNKIYVGMYADFSAKGSDKDGDKLKYTWDFGDEHKSYLKKTRHKYEKAGKYKVTLKVSDGSEDKIETFNVKVEKFPKSKVKILSVSANPKGRDSDSEFITLQNKSKKRINLKDWSVATGSKNLYNHPITKDIIVKPGKTITLTRDFSKFALNNKKAKVELRYPNGKVASKLAYDKKTKSIAEDEIYSKESGQWAWVAPKVETKLAAVQTPGNNVRADIASVQVQTQEAPKKYKSPEINIILAEGKNFSEDANLRKNALENFTRPQGIVLGAATFKPTISGDYSIQNKISYFETIFTHLNSVANYFLNKIFLKLAP